MMKRLTFKRVDPVSAGKVFSVLHLVYGLFVGFFYVMIEIAIDFGRGNYAGTDLIFGATFLLILALILGIVGFIAGILLAVIYNLVANSIGGLVVEVDDESEDDED